MDIKDLQQENSRKIAEKIIEALKFDEDSGVGITGSFVFCFEKDDDCLRTIVNAPLAIPLQLMRDLFETIQKESPVAAYLAEGVLRGAFSQKKDAD